MSWKVALSAAGIFASLLVTEFVSEPAFAAADSLAEAKRFYAAGEYDFARDSLIRELQRSPSNATARYMLGNTYLELQDPAHAIIQYAAALQLAPQSQAGKFSKEALVRLSKDNSMPVPDSDADERRATYANPKITQDPNSRKQDVSAPPTAPVAPLAAAASRNHEFSTECDGRVNDILRQKDLALKEFDRQRDEKISENNSQKFSNAFGHYDPKSDNQAVRREYQAKKDQVVEDCTKHCDEIRAYYRAKEDAMRDTVSSFQDNLSKSGNSSIKMVPLGTNIFTRNYQTTSEASGAAIPVKAAPAQALPKVNGSIK